MADPLDEILEPYAHDQPEYARAFRIFLAHTDQKTIAVEWLTGLVNGLGSHSLFVDAGAGDGSMTAALARWFGRTIAIEPNSTLRAELARRCPEAEIVEAPIGDAEIIASADFVLCSHVLYYIPQKDWIDTLERLASWLGAHGTAVVLLGSSDAGVTALTDDFFGKRIDLGPSVQEFKARHDDFEVAVHTLRCEVVVEDLESACTLARFFLSDHPDWGEAVTRRRLEEYVRSHFTDRRGYRLPCDQDAVALHRR